MLLGLLTVGKAMSQPTGLDPEGFPIFSYIDSTALASRRILGSHRARPPPRGRAASTPPRHPLAAPGGARANLA